ncbi:DUF4143 domain-containing protein [Motilimonas eburnea]|uniref:DUF4143 domain-containing protein n=1 Tax=Motilimonas eburnea TaxID=1737488 RepID=UPI001E3817AB|nr:DUF4143 domain-containing protein [Motilimonas eburnea]MCE2572675.1 ATP-binding protein [Motilimonas eburnea]
MERLIVDTLVTWKTSSARRLLVVSGARGVGKKQLLITQFGKQFNQVHHLDLAENIELLNHIKSHTQANQLIPILELLCATQINHEQDLIVFSGLDQLISKANISKDQLAAWLEALQHLVSKTPALFIACCCVDSSLVTPNLQAQLTQVILRPLSFREFLQASPHRALLKTYTKQIQSPAADSRLMEQFKDYCFTGGLPAAVAAWFSPDITSIHQRVAEVSAVHQRYLAQLRQDMSPSPLPLQAVFEQVANQLATATVTSVQRFKFKGVLPNKHRYQDFAAILQWLQQHHYLLLNYPVHGHVQPPLERHRKTSMLKLFWFDLGLLHHYLGVDYKSLKLSSAPLSGYLLQSFVQQELVASGLHPTYSWQDARAEIEFILDGDNQTILPLEVKSAMRTRAKSMPSYQQKCRPIQMVKLQPECPNKVNRAPSHFQHWPIYFTEFTLDLLAH